MMALLGRNYLPLFKLIKYKIVVFDEIYILFHFNVRTKFRSVRSPSLTYIVAIFK